MALSPRSLLEAVSPPPHRHRWVILSVCMAVALLTAWWDHRLPGSVRLDALYFALVGVTAWYTGLWALTIAAVVVVFGLLPEMAADPTLTSGGPALWNTLGTATLYFAAAVLLSALRRSWQAEQQAARTDALTGLPNRRALAAALGAEVERARRYGTTFALAYMDLDGFKSVNDRYGHETGDRLIRWVGRRLSARTRYSDVAARLGGDEFAVLIPETDRHGATLLVDRLRAALAELFEEGGWEISVSTGLVVVEGEVPDTPDIIRRADNLMYESKRAGKGGVRVEATPAAPLRPGEPPPRPDTPS